MFDVDQRQHEDNKLYKILPVSNHNTTILVLTVIQKHN
jgi:hypothetical protein